MERNLSEKEQRGKSREAALRNLKETSLTDLAVSYLVSSGQYGEEVNSAVEQYKYFPAMQGNGSGHMINGLLSSRQDKKRYTGNISEYGIIQNCAKIIQESLMSITVKDVLELMGSGKGVKGNYGNKYLSDLAKSENKEDKEFFQSIMASYLKYLTDTKVAEALKESAGNIRGGLEEILTESKEERELIN